jgi:hypothetical protein
MMLIVLNLNNTQYMVGSDFIVGYWIASSDWCMCYPLAWFQIFRPNRLGRVRGGTPQFVADDWDVTCVLFRLGRLAVGLWKGQVG